MRLLCIFHMREYMCVCVSFKSKLNHASCSSNSSLTLNISLCASTHHQNLVERERSKAAPRVATGVAVIVVCAWAACSTFMCCPLSLSLSCAVALRTLLRLLALSFDSAQRPLLLLSRLTRLCSLKFARLTLLLRSIRSVVRQPSSQS